MKRFLASTLLILLALSAAAYANVKGDIPPSHWCYYSLETLSSKGLIKEKVVPGKTSLSREKIAALIISASENIKNNPGKMGEAECSSMRQLIGAFSGDIEKTGKKTADLKKDLEAQAERAGLKTASGAKNIQSTEAAAAINDFTVRLYSDLAKGTKNNLFISPYSVSSALAMVYAGARGETAAEMEKVLSFSPEIHSSMGALTKDLNSTPKETAIIRTANALWPSLSTKLLPDYVKITKENYGAAVYPQDYKTSAPAARDRINAWVSSQTQARIRDIIPRGVLNASISMVLTNAVYFKAAWQTEFKAIDTASRPFWITPDKSVNILMMSRTGEDISYAKFEDAELAEIPYKEGRFSMVIVLPSEKKGLEEAEKNLSAKQLEERMAALEPRNVQLTMPKFKMEASYSLDKTLSQMGMPLAFTPQADLSGIDGRRDSLIDAILHKTFVEVAEKGTEAAAATAVIISRTSLEPVVEKVFFTADRPFIFLIKDNKSDAILFIGKYVKP